MAKQEQAQISVPFRGLSISNRSAHTVINGIDGFPSPFGAYLFQIGFEFFKLIALYDFPSPFGAYLFQIIRTNTSTEKWLIFPSPFGAYLFQIICVLIDWGRGWDFRPLSGPIYFKLWTRTVLTDGDGISVPFRGLSISNSKEDILFFCLIVCFSFRGLSISNSKEAYWKTYV